MSEQKTAWFHCGRCGSLFQSKPGAIDRECTECGRDPSLLGLPALAKRTAIPEPRPADGGDDPARSRRESKKEEKPSLMPLKLVIVWLLLLAGVVWIFQYLGDDNDELNDSFAPTARGTMADEQVIFLNEALTECGRSLAGFLSAVTMEGRSQFVLQPSTTAGKMARFYSQNPLPGADAAELRYLRGAILELPGGRAIESVWKAGDSREIEAVFRREAGEWRLDWEHFARFGDHPWPLFLAGLGGSEGEFRLYARERLADRRVAGGALSVVFHAPRFGELGRMSEASPEFIVEPGTPVYRLLDAAFKARREGEIPFDSMLPQDDPGDMIRARVKVSRIEETNDDGETVRRYVLDEVLAAHWLTLDDPGVALESGERPAE